MPKQTPNSPKNPTKLGINKKAQGDARNKTGHVGLADKANSHLIAVLSGGLGDELQAHAYERCRHFFLFVCTIRALEYINNVVLKRTPVQAVSGFRAKATHQVDDGFRSETGKHIVFGRDDPNVIDLPATAFENTDAAHFCNLGIEPSFVSGLDLTDQVTNDLYQELKVFAGNTRWLPQLVNIGPDRRIDILHGKLAQRYLKDASNAVFSRSRIDNYVSEASLSLQLYAQTKTKQKKRGVAACTQCYLKAYGSKDFADNVFKVISGNVVGWCAATKNMAAQSQLLAYG